MANEDDTTKEGTNRSWHLSDASRLLKRFLSHIGRRAALVAAIWAALALIVVIAARAGSPLQQGALVVVGVLLTFILLPDEPSKFWNLNAKTLSETVPPDKLIAASYEVAGALALINESPMPKAAVDTMWETAVQDLTTALSDPSKVAINMDYRISLIPDENEIIVRTAISADRCFKGKNEIFFSFCSDLDALAREFDAQDDGCFARELIPLEVGESLPAWHTRVKRLPPVFIDVEGQRLESKEPLEVVYGDSGAVRFIFDISQSAITERFAQIRTFIEIPTDTSQRDFPVTFRSYYCVGTTEISFEVQDVDAEIEVADFIGSTQHKPQFSPINGMRCTGLTLQAPHGTVLTPGSGAVFKWRRKRMSVTLREPVPTILNLLPVGDELPADTPLPLALIDCEQSPEPLIPIRGLQVLDVYASKGLRDPEDLLARESVAKRLLDAQSFLGDEFSLVILDAWRPLELQHRLLDYYKHGGATREYVADPKSQTLRPPHVTGGAVDLTLAYRGVPLALGTQYDSFDESAHLRSYESEDGMERRLRRYMASALMQAGFAPYPFEWWHWSFGDDVWASRHETHSLFDIVPVLTLDSSGGG